tara:strand:+ start:1804 stop:2007 length:204 start_codon:yes stop_codon:yes gene_type:complete
MKKINIILLNAFLGQLIDLKKGFLKEIVITNNKNADVLFDIIVNAIEEQKELEKAEKDEALLNQIEK